MTERKNLFKLAEIPKEAEMESPLSYIKEEINEFKFNKWMRVLGELEEVMPISIEEVRNRVFDMYLKGHFSEPEADEWIQIIKELSELDNNRIYGYSGINQLELRERAICELVYSSGMTIEEIINLTFGDFVKGIFNYIIEDPMCPNDLYEISEILHSSDNIISIWEINDSKTFISSYESIIAISDYLESDRDQYIPFEDPLFRCDYGGKLSEHHVLSVLGEIKTL